MPKDLPACVELALEIPRENVDTAFPPAKISCVENMLSSLIEAKCLIMYENNGVLCGLLGVKIDTFWWNDEAPRLVDVLFYVRPEYRSYTTFKRMLQVAESFAKINKVPLNLLFFTTKDLDRKYKMILRRGFKPVGFWVSKE